MEEEIERNKDHPHFAPLYFPAELHRHEALAHDLEYFYGPNWQSQVSCSQATQRYVDRIHQVGQEDPVLLVAHAYTRYMGDLSGGQVLKKVAQRAMKLPPTGEGVEFYQFDAIHSAKAFKQLYRSRMNELELDMEMKKRLVDEAVKAFQFNMEVRGQGERMEAGEIEGRRKWKLCAETLVGDLLYNDIWHVFWLRLAWAFSLKITKTFDVILSDMAIRICLLSEILAFVQW